MRVAAILVVGAVVGLSSGRAAAQLTASEQAPVGPRTDGIASSPPAGIVAAEAQPWRLEAHAGWWDMGLDVASPIGVFGGVGVPWPWLLLNVLDDIHRVVPLDANVGFRQPMSDEWSISVQMLTAWIAISKDEQLLDGPKQRASEHHVYLLPSIGTRYVWSSGVFVGASLVPLAGKWQFRDGDTPSARVAKWGFAPEFSQVHVGGAWEL